MSNRYDVLAVDMKTHKIEVIGSMLSERGADAVECMAVARRGVDDQFFVTEPAGKYSDGDEWRPEEA